jgi:Domain of unknown function (DUF6754)
MILTNIMGLLLVVLGILLMAGFTFLARQGFKPPLRPISGYEALARQVGQAVESGGRVHVSLGSGSVNGEDTGTTLAGLAMLDYVADASSISDLSPVATTGDATTLPVMSDTIRRAYARKGVPDKFEMISARLVSLDPFSMAAGTTSLIVDDDVRANVLVGSFGVELALPAEAGQRRRISQVAGSDRLEGQAVAYAMADHPLIGEELYVSRAYLTREPSATAALATQDVLRWIAIVAILVGSVMATLGLIH